MTKHENEKTEFTTVEMGGVMENVRNEKGKPSAAPLTLTWTDLKYSVNEKKGKEMVRKTILHNINGRLAPNEMVAIMGTSGAGKTTFLNVLAARNSEGDVEGQILLNGERRSKSFRRTTAYVEQDDLLMPFLTVKETFTFNALLRLSNKYTTSEKKARAIEVLTELGLTHCQETQIGGPMARGVSGGERKRCSIGIELITDPRVLFLDEPTSGLDSFTSYHVMMCVRELSQKGRGVMCTIHQPRSNIFALFDKLLLLSKGHTIFYGPAVKAADFFASNGFPCPPQTNVADHFLDVTTVDTRTPELERVSRERNEALISMFAASSYAKIAAEDAEPPKSEGVNGEKKRQVGTTFATSWLQQFLILYRRAFLNFTRNKRATVAVFAQTVVMALITGAVFFHLGHGQSSIQSRSGALFFITLNQTFGPLIGSIILFHLEKSLFMRERSSGTYRVLPYYISRAFAEFPVQIWFPIVFSLIVYWMIDLNSRVDRVLFFMLTLCVHFLTSQSLGLLISAITPSVQVGQGIAPVIVIVFMLFGGFFLNTANVWVGFVWIEYISFIGYTFKALAVNEYAGMTFTCDNSSSGLCETTGEQVLQNLNFGGSNKWEDLGLLFCIAVVAHILAYLCLLFLGKPKTKFA